jgi:hypothetical protein
VCLGVIVFVCVRAFSHAHQGVLSLEQVEAMMRRCGPTSLTEEQINIFILFDFNKFGQQNGPRLSGVYVHSSLFSLLSLSPSHPYPSLSLFCAHVWVRET